MPPPRFDQDLRFGKAVEDFAIAQFVAQAAVERLDVAVLLRFARIDVLNRAGFAGG